MPTEVAYSWELLALRNSYGLSYWCTSFIFILMGNNTTIQLGRQFESNDGRGDGKDCKRRPRRLRGAKWTSFCSKMMQQSQMMPQLIPRLEVRSGETIWIASIPTLSLARSGETIWIASIPTPTLSLARINATPTTTIPWYQMTMKSLNRLKRARE